MLINRENTATVSHRGFPDANSPNVPEIFLAIAVLSTRNA